MTTEIFDRIGLAIVAVTLAAGSILLISVAIWSVGHDSGLGFYGHETSIGLAVDRIDPESPADLMGLKAGDVIESVGAEADIGDNSSYGTGMRPIRDIPQLRRFLAVIPKWDQKATALDFNVRRRDESDPRRGRFLLRLPIGAAYR